MINITIDINDKKSIFLNVDCENVEKIIEILTKDYLKKEICTGLKYPGYCEDCIFKINDLNSICNKCTKDNLFDGSSPSEYKSLDTLVKKSYKENISNNENTKRNYKDFCKECGNYNTNVCDDCMALY